MRYSIYLYGKKSSFHEKGYGDIDKPEHVTMATEVYREMRYIT